MSTVEVFKPLGLLSIVIGWAGLIYIIRKWPGNKSMSFSSHAATTKSGVIFYGLLFSVSLPMFYLFIAKWFTPTVSMPGLFTQLVFIACIGQIIAVWVPAVDQRKKLIHNTAAYTMHTLLILLVFMVLIYGDVSAFSRLVALFAVIYMITVWCVFALTKFSKKYTLWLQASYVAMFHITILTATYIQ